MIEASKVDQSASYVVGWWWLLAAFLVSAARTLHLDAFEAGGAPFQNHRRQKEIPVRNIRAKRTRFGAFGGLQKI